MSGGGWTQGTSNYTLTNNNLTATRTAGANDNLRTLATFTRNTAKGGKFQFEIKLTVKDATTAYYGVSSDTSSFTSSGSLAWNTFSNNFTLNAAAPIYGGNQVLVNDVMGFVFDFTNPAVPVANAYKNGVIITGGSFNLTNTKIYYPAIFTSTTGAACILNLGGDGAIPFAYPIAGYTPWDPPQAGIAPRMVSSPRPYRFITL